MRLLNRIEELEKELLELKELVKEEQWFPQEDDFYWYVDPTGRALIGEWEGFNIAKDMLEIGNIFQTEEQAQFALEKLKVEAELRKFSRPFLWGTENTAILFDGDNIKFDTRMAYVFQGAIYFESENKAKEAIETVGEERVKKYIFGVEE